MKKGLLKTKDQSIDGFVRSTTNFVRDKDIVRIRDGFLDYGSLTYDDVNIIPLITRNVWIGNEEFVLFFATTGDLFAYPVGRDIPNNGNLNLYKVARQFEYKASGIDYTYYFPDWGKIENNVVDIVETKKYIYVLTNERQWVIVKDGIVRFDDDNKIVLFNMKDATITDMEDDEYQPQTLKDITGKILKYSTVSFRYRSELGGRGKPSRDYVLSATKPVIGVPNTNNGMFVLDNGRLQLPVIGYIVKDGSGLEPPYNIKIFADFDDALGGLENSINKKDDTYLVWRMVDSNGTLACVRDDFSTAVYDDNGYYRDVDTNYTSAPLLTTADVIEDILIEITPSGKKFMWYNDDLSLVTGNYILLRIEDALYMAKIGQESGTDSKRYFDSTYNLFKIDTTVSSYFIEIETEFNGDGKFGTAFHNADGSYNQLTAGRFFHGIAYINVDQPALVGIITQDIAGYDGIQDPTSQVTTKYTSIEDFNVWKIDTISGTSFKLITRDGAVYIGQDEQDNVVVYGGRKVDYKYIAPEIWLNNELVVSSVDFPYQIDSTNFGNTPTTNPSTFIALPVIATKPTLAYAGAKQTFTTRSVGEWHGVRYYNCKFFFFVQNTIKITNELLEWNVEDTIYTDGDVLDLVNYADGLLVITTQGLFELTPDKDIKIKKISNIKNVVRAIPSNNSNIVFLQTNTGRFLVLVRKYEQGVPQNVVDDISQTFYVDAETWQVYDAVFWEDRLWIATTNGVYMRNNEGDIWRIDIEDPLKFIITREKLLILTGAVREGLDITEIDPMMLEFGGA